MLYTLKSQNISHKENSNKQTMELNEINSANMTDRIVESISRTNDGSVHEENSALNEHIQREDREENDEGDYEEYRFRYQEYGQERKSANTRNDRSIAETFLKRCQECNQEIEETEELYEECIYEGDYEKYRFRCQECGQERKSVNTRNGRSIDETLFQKFLNRKWWFLCLIRLNFRIKNRHNFFFWTIFVNSF